ncbi:MAG: hypothetical protein N3A02_00680, partial [Rectinema sp.]|nr:hypothetical protein [Rectinema sp.]
MNPIYERLDKEDIKFFEYGITALDAYYDEVPRPIRFLVAECSTVDLARCFENLGFPGLPYADAALVSADPQHEEFRFVCAEDALHCHLGGAWSEFRRDPIEGVFFDPGDIYADIKNRALPVVDTTAG